MKLSAILFTAFMIGMLSFMMAVTEAAPGWIDNQNGNRQLRYDNQNSWNNGPNPSSNDFWGQSHGGDDLDLSDNRQAEDSDHDILGGLLTDRNLLGGLGRLLSGLPLVGHLLSDLYL